MANKKTTGQDWTTIRGPIMRCSRCRGIHILALPMGLTEVGKVCKAFSELHKYCKKKY